jgi:hypothetical protein
MKLATAGIAAAVVVGLGLVVDRAEPTRPTPAPLGASNQSVEPSPDGFRDLASAIVLLPGTSYYIGAGMNISVPTSGWVLYPSIGTWSIEKGGTPDPITTADPIPPDARVGFRVAYPNGIFADPCGREMDDPVHGQTPESGADWARQRSVLAAAVAAIPGVKVTAEPSDTSVGHLQATHVAIAIPEDMPCDERDLGYGHVHRKGAAIAIWIVDYRRFGLRYWIEAETARDASPELRAEIQELVRSIGFAG